MLDERKVRVYAWYLRQGMKTIDEISDEYKQEAIDYNLSLPM